MRQETRNDLILAALFFAVIFIFTGSLLIAAIFMAALAWHEYGHVIAFRQAGHRRVRWRFIPFLGAVAWSAAPTRTQLERLYIALMGPGFSLLLLAICVIALHLVDPEGPLLRPLAIAITVIGFLNALNLLPLWPLDGAHVLRAMLAGWAPPGVARNIMIGGGALLVVLALLRFQIFIALFAFLNVLALMRDEETADPAAAALLTPRERLLGAGAYFTTLLAHGIAGWPWISGFIGLGA